MDNIPHTLRNVFSNKYTEKHGTSWQVAFGKPLSHQIKCRFKDQQHLVASGDPQKWDSTILCNVLLHPSWQLTKLESDAIKNLQNIRNICFAHRAEATISSQELSDIVQDIEKAYKDMKIPLSEISTMKDIEKGMVCFEYAVHVNNMLYSRLWVVKRCHDTCTCVVHVYYQCTLRPLVSIHFLYHTGSCIAMITLRYALAYERSRYIIFASTACASTCTPLLGIHVSACCVGLPKVINWTKRTP